MIQNKFVAYCMDMFNAKIFATNVPLSQYSIFSVENLNIVLFN